MSQQLRVLLADDHESVRQGLRALFESVPDVEVVQDVGDGRSAVEAVRTIGPDLVVLDLSMPDINGFSALREIKRENPRISVIVLTRHRDAGFVREAFTAGASGYVLKQSPFSELRRAVEVVSQGFTHVDGRLTSPPARPVRSEPLGRPHGLSDREFEVLHMSALGCTNKEVASRLGISVKTVEVHKSNAMRKLNLHDRSDLLRYASLHGWLNES